MVSTVMRLIKKTNIVILVSYVISIFIFSTSYYAGYSMNTHYIQDETSYNVMDIFINNTIISIVMFLGVFSLGLINLGLAVINGFNVGSLMQFVTKNMDYSEIMWNIIPHGIFEIPSIIISTSIGFIPAILLIQKAHRKHKINYMLYVKYVGVLFLVVLLLNIIAAIVEVNVTMNS